MKRLLLLAIVAAIAWYGWQHRGQLFGGSADSEVVLVNSGTRAMLRARLTVDGQTYVREAVEPGGRETIRVKVANASDFRVQWQWRGLEGAYDWRGGEIAPGPPRSRCTVEVFDDNEAVVACSPMPTDDAGR